jgi:ribosome biogenesis GTPase A
LLINNLRNHAINLIWTFRAPCGPRINGSQAIVKLLYSNPVSTLEFPVFTVTSDCAIPQNMLRRALPISSQSLFLHRAVRSFTAERAGNLNSLPDICMGCGVKFVTDQSKSHAPGFVPSEMLENYHKKLELLKEKEAEEEEIKRSKLNRDGKKGETSANSERKNAKQEKTRIQKDNVPHGFQDAVSTHVSDPDLFDGLKDTSSLQIPHFPKRKSNFQILEDWDLDESRNIKAKPSYIDLPDVNPAEDSTLSFKEVDHRDVIKSKSHDEGDHHEDIVCMRCYQLKHYGKVKGETQGIVADDFRSLLENRFFGADIPSAVIVKVIDILDFHGSIIPDIKKIVHGRNPVVLVLNKIDLLCKGVSMKRIREWANLMVSELELQVHSLHIVSAKNGEGLVDLMREVAELAAKKRRNVYIIGATNVGKSTLVNQLIKKNLIFSPVSKTASVTTSKTPGTTLGFVPFNLYGPGTEKIYSQSTRRKLKACTAFDTPGIVRYEHLHYHLNSTELSCAEISNRLVPVTFTISQGQVLMLGGYVTIEQMSSRSQRYTIFCSNKLSVHIANSQERALELLETRIGDVIFPPFSSERLQEFPLKHEKVIKINLSRPDRLKKSKLSSTWDVVFDGIGWISLCGFGEVDLRIRSAVPGILVREPLLPFEVLRTQRKFVGKSVSVIPESVKRIINRKRENATTLS